MKPLPDLSDDKAMLIRGRQSAIWGARKEACEALRNAAVQCQSATLENMAEPARDAIKAAERLIEVATLAGINP